MGSTALAWILTAVTAASTLLGSSFVFIFKVTPEKPLPPKVLASSLGCASGVSAPANSLLDP